MDLVFELIYEDLTHLGSSMDTEYTTEHSLGLFKDVIKAKEAAKTNYKRKIKWLKDDSLHGYLRSDDLGHVMYHIRKREVRQ